MTGVDKVVDRVSVVLRRELDILHRQLIESGLDEEKVTEAFGAYSTATTKKYATNIRRKGEMTIVLDYGPKTHAVFGDDKTLKTLTVGLTWIRYNRDLLFGSGYLIRDKTKIDDLKTIFREKNITFKEINRKEYEDAGRKTDTVPPLVSEESPGE